MYHFPLFSNLILINKLNGLIIFNIFISLQQKCQRICSSKVGFFFPFSTQYVMCSSTNDIYQIKYNKNESIA